MRMKTEHLLLTGLLIIVITFVSIVSISDYPYILQPLSETELQALNEEFKDKTGLPDCRGLDRFGLLYHACKYGSLEEEEVTDVARVIDMAKDFLVEHSQFTGVLNKNDVVLANEGLLYHGSERIQLQSNSQTHKGWRVLDTIIGLYVDNKQVWLVAGHWYPTIKVPAKPRITEQEVKESLIGKELTAQYPSDIAADFYNYTVTSADLETPAELVVFPLESEKELEFRLAWEVVVSSWPTPLGPTSWAIYIDAMTGEELEISEYGKLT